MENFTYYALTKVVFSSGVETQAGSLAKAITLGVLDDGDVWELYRHERRVDRALPVGSVLTIAAAGSEMSGGSVVTNEVTHEKCDYGGDVIRPKFALLNPELTTSLPWYQTAVGDKANLLVAVSDALSQTVPAGALIKAIAPAINGGGGGRPTLAQAGGKKPAGLNTAIEQAVAFMNTTK